MALESLPATQRSAAHQHRLSNPSILSIPVVQIVGNWGLLSAKVTDEDYLLGARCADGGEQAVLQYRWEVLGGERASN